MVKTEKFKGYTVRELTLGQFRALHKQGLDSQELQYEMAVLTVTKPDGQPITLAELDAMGLSEVMPLLKCVARVNGSAVGDEGND